MPKNAPSVIVIRCEKVIKEHAIRSSKKVTKGHMFVAPIQCGRYSNVLSHNRGVCGVIDKSRH